VVAEVAGTLTLEAEKGMDVDSEHGATQAMVPGEHRITP